MYRFWGSGGLYQNRAEEKRAPTNLDPDVVDDMSDRHGLGNGLGILHRAAAVALGGPVDVESKGMIKLVDRRTTRFRSSGNGEPILREL
jgi:hypothetical protein